MSSGSPCHASRGHSISFTGSIIHCLSDCPTGIHYDVHQASNEQYQASHKRNRVQEAIVWVAIGFRNIPATLGRAMDCEMPLDFLSSTSKVPDNQQHRGRQQQSTCAGTDHVCRTPVLNSRMSGFSAAASRAQIKASRV